VSPIIFDIRRANPPYFQECTPNLRASTVVNDVDIGAKLKSPAARGFEVAARRG
jgi:hypothetical protein